MTRMLNAQEIFDKAVGGLLKQGKRSTVTRQDGKTFCAYRSDDGCKCPAGQLIEDEYYDQEMEGSGIAELYPDMPEDQERKLIIINHAMLDSGVDLEEHLSLIWGMQQSHDTNKTMDDIKISLRNVAAKFGLSTAIIDEWEASHSQTA